MLATSANIKAAYSDMNGRMICNIPLSNGSILLIFTYRPVYVCKKKTLCVLKHLGYENHGHEDVFEFG